MSNTHDYDGTVARIAGNLIGHLLARRRSLPVGETYTFEPSDYDVRVAVATARAIVSEIKRTEPEATP